MTLNRGLDKSLANVAILCLQFELVRNLQAGKRDLATRTTGTVDTGQGEIIREFSK